MQGYKIVTAEEMARIEQGGDHEKYVEEAGRKVAEYVIRYVDKHDLAKKVTLLVGKGNNGADAYAAGICLIEEGFQVSACALYQEVSALNQKFSDQFRKKKGRFSDQLDGIIVDGLLGTGFKGKVEKKMAALIKRTNDSGLPIIAVDIPSGLSATSGEIGGCAIVANETIALGLPKIGFFIQQGWNYVGRLHIADFGLPLEAIAAADAVAYIPKKLELPKIQRVRHKYEAGYVLGYAGSKQFPGAAIMAGYAALKAGAGIVRVFHRDEIGQGPLELICNSWDEKAWKEEIKRAKAIFIGPGLGNVKDWLKKELKEIQVPCVIDADALLNDISYPKGAVLTPHRGEALRLLALKHQPADEEFFAKVIRYCSRKGVYVVLKGAPTFIFGPKHKPIIVPRGDPGMATAGSGDVLTGMIASMLAQGLGPYEAAIVAVALHAISGEIAAEHLTSYCLIATDLIDFIPLAFQEILKTEMLK